MQQSLSSISRIYDLTSDIDEPEQILRLYSLFAYEGDYEYEAIDFSFGSSRLSWDLFTIYFLMSGGDIFALSPIVPYGALLSDSVLLRLKEKALARIEELQKESSNTELAQKRFRTQLSWLTEGLLMAVSSYDHN